MSFGPVSPSTRPENMMRLKKVAAALAYSCSRGSP